MIRLWLGLALACLCVACRPTATTQNNPNSPPPYTVVWADGADLYGWRGDGNGARRILLNVGEGELQLSPDASRIAFTRADGQNADVLFVVNFDGTEHHELVNTNTLSNDSGGEIRIQDFRWATPNLLLFNTSAIYDWGGFSALDTLYAIDFPNRTLRVIFEAPRGGAFTLSPNGLHAAVTSAGLRESNAQLQIVETATGVVVKTMRYEAPPLSENTMPLYPRVEWESDGLSLRLSVPNLSESNITVWRVPLQGEPAVRAYVSGSPYGLPERNETNGSLIYLADVNTSSQSASVMVADADGTQSRLISSGVRIPRAYGWVNETSRYYFTQGTANAETLWLGQGTTPPLAMPYTFLHWELNGTLLTHVRQNADGSRGLYRLSLEGFSNTQPVFMAQVGNITGYDTVGRP